MGALHDLVAGQLAKVGIRAQEEIEDHDKWMKVSDELSVAWRCLHNCRFEQSAEHLKSAQAMTERIIEEEQRGADRQ